MTKHWCLLVVNDTGIASQITPALEQAGWDVQLCTSAREAIYVGKHKNLDGLLIAATLADERGDVVYYRLAALQPHLRARTLFLNRTSHDWDVIEATQRVGLQLPVTPGQVVHTVSNFYDTPPAS